MIGKGGETVREISRLSGAAVGLDRAPATVAEAPGGVQERMLRIDGAMAQVSNALWPDAWFSAVSVYDGSITLVDGARAPGREEGSKFPTSMFPERERSEHAR